MHPAKLAGESAESKRTRLAEDLKKRNADAAVLTLPDSVCWLLNIRGADVPHTPFALSFAISNADGSVDLFMDERKTSPELLKHFGNGVRVHAPDKFVGALDALKGKTGDRRSQLGVGRHLRPATKGGRQGSARRRSVPAAQGVQERGRDRGHAPVPYPRRRGADAVPRLVRARGAQGPPDRDRRGGNSRRLSRATGALKDVSFDSISGAGPNGAIVHYRVTKKTNRRIEPGQLFLIDSGAQFEDGTTDVTRTVAVGAPTAEMRDRFTRVLKGHIALATARFPEGTTGAQLDAFARRPLWDAGLDYGHGTGHGVGSYLSVHEGPQSISSRGTGQALKPGMICSNEPGYYKTGEYGIRIENLVVVNPLEQTDGDRPMMSFETITMAPIDLDLVEPSLLTAAEREWLNAYHADVRAKIATALKDDADARAWLDRAARPI